MSNNNNKYIPVVFATDDGYAMPTAVAITSLIANKKKDTIYKIYLISPGLSKENKKKLLSMSNKSCEIEIIYAPELLKDKVATLEKVSSTDYYRLMLDTILTNEDKVIALDGDLLVLSDLTDLYNIDIEDNYIGGVYFRPHDIYNREYVQNTLGLDEGKRINIGIMLMNLKKIRQDNIQDEFLKYIGKFAIMSEDIINYVCKNKIKLIPLKYNYNLHYYKYKDTLVGDPVYSCDDYFEAEKNPAIFHYTLEKPWKIDVKHHQDLWIKYKKASPYKYTKVFGEKRVLEKFFSVTNKRRNQKIYKTICLFGIKISFRNTRKEQEELLQKISNQLNAIDYKLNNVMGGVNK